MFLFKNLTSKIFNLGPIILLYYLSISEIDTHFSNLFEILSFNIQLIIMYYWMLRDGSIAVEHGFSTNFIYILDPYNQFNWRELYKVFLNRTQALQNILATQYFAMCFTDNHHFEGRLKIDLTLLNY